MNKEQCLSKLDEISKLEYDWDSYNGLPISTVIIDSAIRLLEALDYKNVEFIAPYSVGIQIELKLKQDNKEAEIGVEKNTYDILLCPAEEFSSWIELDNLTLEETVNKVTEFFNNKN